jgi:hypothetical protein
VQLVAKHDENDGFHAFLRTPAWHGQNQRQKINKIQLNAAPFGYAEEA